MLEELQEGICSFHVGGKALAHKVIRMGYFWPSIKRDAKDFTKKCRACQINDTIQRNPSTKLTGISSLIPFDMWGLDIVGPFPTSTAQAKFIFVAIDYFTKWVEAAAVANITQQTAWKFIYTHNICRFGVPQNIIRDNGS